MTWVALVRPAWRWERTSHNSVTAKSEGICWISPSTRVCGAYSTNTAAPRSTYGCNSVLPGQSPPTALMCMPGSTMLGVMMVALALSAVTVVTISAPRTASATLVHTRTVTGRSLRLASNLRVASRSVSKRRSSVMPSRWWKARAWNSLCAPLPINAMLRLPGRASARAATADMAAVRNAVVRVSSDSSRGIPVVTSASTPKAITVDKPRRVLPGWPFTYLNE